MTHIKAEMKKLEELRMKVEIKQKKLKTEQKKIAKERKALDADKKKINSQWKELDRAKKNFADQKDLTSKQGLSSSAKQGRKRASTNKKIQDEFFQMKRKYEAESKKARDYRKKLDQLEVENKVLRNKNKNLSGKKRGRGDDKRVRQLIRENRELRKRLRKLMKELNKRRRWYKRHIRVFKKNQDKWIKTQRNAFKDKKLIIKYVFLDDVKYIKQYQKPRKGRDKIKFKNRIRVKTKGGGETTVKGVEIIVVDADNDDDDDDDDAEDTNDDNGKKNGKKKKKNNRGYFGETHGGLKKRFSVSDTFYSGILPLDILPHSYLIMLLFQDYNERTDSVVVKTDRQNKMNKGGSPYHYVKGLIMDMAMDDAELIKNQKETSSIITLELRKWMYRILLSNVKKECDHEDDTSAFDVMLDKKELRMKELICYAAPRLCFREDMTKREWLKGISVDVNGDNDEDNVNPLYQLESYKFVKNALENEAKSDTDEDEDEFCVEIPQEYMVRDIIYLLTYLKDLDRKKVKQKQKEEEEKEKEEEIKSKTKEQKDDATHSQSANDANIPFVFGVADAGNDVNNDSLKTNGANTEIETNTKSEDKQWSTKKTKKDKKRKRGKRGRGGNKRKKQKTTHSTNNGQAKQKESVKKKKDKVKKTAKKKKKKKHGLTTWNEFKLLVNSFLYQWKYR
eukprot:675847_1